MLTFTEAGSVMKKKLHEMLSAESITTLINNINDAVFIHSEDGKIIYVNDKALQLFGMKREDVGKLSMVDDLSGPGATVEDVRVIWNKVLSDEAKSTVIEWVAKRPFDGTAFAVSLQLTKVYFKNNIAILTIVRDMSKEKQAEQILRESEERYRLAIECSNDGVVMVNSDKLVFANQKCAEMFGYDSPDELIGKTIATIVHHDDLKMVSGSNAKSHSGEQLPAVYEFKGIKKDGSTIHIEASAANIYYQGASTTLAYIRDVTKQNNSRRLIKIQRDLSMKLARAVSVTEALTYTLDELIKATSTDSGGVYLYNKKTGDLELACATGLSDEFVKAVSIIRNGSDEMRRVKLYDKDRAALYYNPPEKTVFTDATMKEGIKLVECVPITYENEPKGIICITSHKDKLLTVDNVINILQTAAAQLSTVLNRLETEHRLNKSEAQFKRIFDNSMIGMFKVMLDGSMLDANCALAKIYGYKKRDEFLRAINNNSLKTYRNPEDRQPFVDMLLKNGAVVNFEKRARHKNGDTIWVRISAKLVQDDDGTNWIEGMSEDITAKKFAEKQLENQVRLLNSVLDGVPDIIGIQYPEHTIMRYNKAGYDVLGMTSDDVKGKKCYSLIGRDRPCDNCMTAKAVVSGKTEQTEKYIAEFDRYMFCRSTPVFDRNGKLSLIVEQLQDITAMKHAEADIIRCSEAMDAAIDGMAILNNDETYAYVNFAHSKIYGYDNPDELTGKSWHVLYSPGELKRFEKDVMPKLYREGRWRGEATGRKKDGSMFAQELSLTVLSGGGLICVVRDITERKKTETVLFEKSLFLQTVIDSCPHPVFYKDSKGRYSGCNVEFEKICNVSTDIIINKTADALFTDRVAKMEAVTDKKVMKSKSVAVYEENITLNNKATKRLLVTKAPYLRGDGTVEGIVGTISDITALREAEERYKLFAEHSNDGIAILSNGVHAYANKRFTELFGYDDINDIIGKGHEIVIAKEDVERVRRYSMLRNNGKHANNHYIARGVKKNGDLIYVDISVAAISYKGTPSSLAFMRDVTDRVINMKELKKAEESYRTVFENTGAGTIIIEDDTIISLVNNKFLHMAGYSNKMDIEGIKSWKEFFDASVIGFMETYHIARRNEEQANKIPTQYTSMFIDRYGNRKHVLMTVGMIPNKIFYVNYCAFTLIISRIFYA